MGESDGGRKEEKGGFHPDADEFGTKKGGPRIDSMSCCQVITKAKPFHCHRCRSNKVIRQKRLEVRVYRASQRIELMTSYHSYEVSVSVS